jgi:hypothetical protein
MAENKISLGNVCKVKASSSGCMLLTLFLKFQLECTDASFSTVMALTALALSLAVKFVFINSNEFKPSMKVI